MYDASSVSGSVSGSISASPAPYATEGMFDFSEDTKPEQTIAAESILPSTSANEAILDDETMEGFADLTQFILGVCILYINLTELSSFAASNVL